MDKTLKEAEDLSNQIAKRFSVDPDGHKAEDPLTYECYLTMLRMMKGVQNPEKLKQLKIDAAEGLTPELILTLVYLDGFHTIAKMGSILEEMGKQPDQEVG